MMLFKSSFGIIKIFARQNLVNSLKFFKSLHETEVRRFTHQSVKFLKYLSVIRFSHHMQKLLPADPGKLTVLAPPFASTPRGSVTATTTVATDGTRATVVSSVSLS